MYINIRQHNTPAYSLRKTPPARRTAQLSQHTPQTNQRSSAYHTSFIHAWNENKLLSAARICFNQVHSNKQITRKLYENAPYKIYMQTNIADNFEILLYLKLFSEIKSFSASFTIPPLTFAARVKTTCFTFFWTTVFMMLVVLPFFPNSPTCSKIETKWQICHNYGLLYSCSTFEINKNLVNL